MNDAALSLSMAGAVVNDEQSGLLSDFVCTMQQHSK